MMSWYHVSRCSFILNIILIIVIIMLLVTQNNVKKEPLLFKPQYSRSGDMSIDTTRTLLTVTRERSVRILCVILTSPDNHLTKAVHVEATWGQRCHKMIFLTDTSSDQLPHNLTFIQLEDVRGREKLWYKVQLGMKEVWRRYKDDFDYLLKADDDTFIVMNNLISLLQSKQEDDFILGHNQKVDGVSYHSGGSGYVMTHGAVKTIVEQGFSEVNGNTLCDLPHQHGDEVSHYPNEDLQMGSCASLLNIKILNSQVQGQSTFFPFPFHTHLIQDLSNTWFINHTSECSGSVDCVSPHVISLHYVDPQTMYVLHFMTEVFKNNLL